MQVSVETTSGLERKMTVEVPLDSIDSAVNERLQSLARTARLNGFRPGKVPFKVVKKRYEPQVRSEVLGDVINRSFQEAVVQEKLRPAGQPRIEPVSRAEAEQAEAGQQEPGQDTGESDAAAAGKPAAAGTPADNGFSYTAVFEVYPEFEPKFDSSIVISKPVVEIAETDIDEMLDTLRKQRIQYDETDRPSQLEDQVNIDFTGSIDGVEFEGGKAEDAPLVLGSGAMIPGFEDQLVGVSTGDEKTITVTFPEGYGSEELAGKEAQFAIKVKSVNEPVLPALDESLVKSFGIESGQIEDLRADITSNMQRELKQRIDSQVKQQVMDGLLNLNDIEVPKALAQQEIGRLKEQLAQQMPPQSADAPARSPDDLPDEMFAEEANRRVRLGLVVGEIVRHKSLTADAGAVRAQVEAIASTYQDPQQVVDYYMSNQELLQNVEGLVLEQAVTQSVLDSATVNDQKMSFQEMMNPPAEAGDGAGNAADPNQESTEEA